MRQPCADSQGLIGHGIGAQCMCVCGGVYLEDHYLFIINRGSGHSNQEN